MALFLVGTNWKNNKAMSSSARLLIQLCVRRMFVTSNPFQLDVPVHCNMINWTSMPSKDLLGRVTWLYCSGYTPPFVLAASIGLKNDPLWILLVPTWNGWCPTSLTTNSSRLVFTKSRLPVFLATPSETGGDSWRGSSSCLSNEIKFIQDVRWLNITGILNNIHLIWFLHMFISCLCFHISYAWRIWLIAGVRLIRSGGTPRLQPHQATPQMRQPRSCFEGG